MIRREPAAIKPHRSSLQFALQLVEKAPVGALGENLLRARFDHPRLVQFQRVEADRVLGIVLPPFVVSAFFAPPTRARTREVTRAESRGGAYRQPVRARRKAAVGIDATRRLLPVLG